MLQRLLLNRLLIVAGAASLSLASPWPAVAGADAAQVTVVSPGGIQRPLSLDALAGSEDVRERSYRVRSTAGEESRAVTGFSLAAVLDAAGVDPFGFSYLEVERPVGGSVLLSRHQALDAGAFPEGPPLVYAASGGTAFLRPAADGEDANGGDCFEAPQGVTIVLRRGSLQVQAKASTMRVRPGQKVDFSAAVERAGAGEPLTYSWYFDDGDSASGPTASHSFAKRGSYDVVVGVTAPGDDAGASAVVTVQVGAPAAGGPDRKGGGSNRAAGAPDSGAAAGPSGPAAGGAGAAAGTGGAATSTGTATSGAGAVPSPAPATPPAAPSPAPSKPRHSPSTDGTTRVSGPLLSEAAPTAAPDAPAAEQVAARAGTASDSDTGGSGLPTAAWGLLAGAGLLGAGALLEARGLPGLRRLSP